MKTVGKCTYCKDPVYDFQEKVTVDTRKQKGILHHKGCFELMTIEVNKG